KQTASDLKAAVQSFRYSARLFESAHANNRAAKAHFGAGEGYSTLSQYESARRSFHRALQLGQEAELRCKILSRLARTYATTGPFSLADRYSSQAISVCEHLDEGGQAEALQARGEALDFAGERSKSDAYILRARDLFARTKNVNGQADAESVLSYH